MGHKQDQIYNMLLQAIQNMQKPQNNPAQNYLTNEAMAAGDFFKQGDYSQLPKGMFFDFQMPAEQLKNYQSTANAATTGTAALADSSGMTEVNKLQGRYIGDKFARDAAQNYQNNIAGAAGNTRSALEQAAGAQGETDSRVISALQGLYSSPALNKPSIWGSLLGGIGSIGAAAITKW